LHDTTAQNLAAIRLNLAIVRRSLDAANAKMLESVDESIALTDESIGEVRTLAYLLHPPMIEEAGLLVSLRWFAQGFEARSGIRVTLDFPEALSRLPLEMETAIFRIVQEGLNNIQRHSGSTVARISIERPPNVLRLQIEDKGRGLPLHLRGNDAVTAGAGVGLASIRERVREFGGAMSVQSDDDGTVLSVTLPLSED
jgi:signal transduction histidine kinase